MAYPTYPQDVGSTASFEDGRVVYRSESGKMMASTLYASVALSFSVKHTLSSDDLDTLQTFYAANLVTPFDFVWSLDGATYSVVFGPGGLRVTPGAVYHSAVVDLRQV